MKVKFISIFPNNNKTYLQNSMFDIHNNKNRITEEPIYAKLRASLKRRGIYLNTHDIPILESSYLNIHFDMPFPIPANFLILESILKNTKKNILLCTEPPMVNPFNYLKMFHKYFSKVYTWNDDLIDNKKYFEIKLPKTSEGINTPAKRFKDKRFLTLINTNKLPFYPFKLFMFFGKELYSERIKAIEFFERNIPEDFHFYGMGWNLKKKYNLKEAILGYKQYSTYGGGVDNKIELLSKFKYCICFENLTNVKGYVSEKIFDCFKAKCIPVYWGASNIQSYIPKDCFIDFRDFDFSYEKLLNFLISIDESRYNLYIDKIEKLLSHEKFVDFWFEKGFLKFFSEDVLELKKV